MELSEEERVSNGHHQNDEEEDKPFINRQKGGFITMPFILGNYLFYYCFQLWILHL